MARRVADTYFKLTFGPLAKVMLTESAEVLKKEFDPPAGIGSSCSGGVGIAARSALALSNIGREIAWRRLTMPDWSLARSACRRSLCSRQRGYALSYNASDRECKE